MKFDLNLSQQQKLVMTQQMQLSVKILQMSTYELEKYIQKEIEENPVLDIKDEEFDNRDKKDKIDYKELIEYFQYNNRNNYSEYESNKMEQVSPFSFISEEKSLKQYLKEQIIILNENDCVKKICEYMIENIDTKGYLSINLEDIQKEFKTSMDIVEYSLKILQGLDPIGIGSRNLKECLKIQIKYRGINDKNLFVIVDDYLEYLAENKYDIIAKRLSITVKEAQGYGDFIKSLEPKPSRGFYTGDDVKYIMPDAYIKKIDKEYFIIMNDETLPKLTINTLYKQIIKKEDDDKAVNYVKEKLDSAIFLIKSIQSRKSTLYKVLEKVLQFQKEYFEYGINYLKPMNLKDIAENINMHESTVSRAIRDKYICTDKGTIKIKDLFTTGISSNTNKKEYCVNFIKNSIVELINKEDKRKPLSDQKISDILKEKKINISRRTVAKYREELQIKSSKGRKRF